MIEGIHNMDNGVVVVPVLSLEYMQMVADVANKMLLPDMLASIDEAIKVLNKHIGYHSPIYVCGNGGDAALANHFAIDVMKMTKNKARVYSLSANIPVVTALGNDSGYDRVFVEQVPEYEHPVWVLLSTSGQSPNVLAAEARAIERSEHYIFITRKGKMHDGHGIYIEIPSDSTQVLEDMQSAVLHCIALGLKREVN